MSILSLEFFISVFAAIILYYCIPKKTQWPFLLLLSLSFLYLNGSVQLMGLFLGIALVAWGGALWIDHLQPAHKRLGCILAVGLLVGTLFYCRDLQVLNIAKHLVNGIFKTSMIYVRYDIIPLLGISYFMLSLIGYVMDVYWGKYAAEKNYFKLLLFAGYFPQMTSGPITRYSEMQAQLFTAHRFDVQKLILGAERTLWGCFKKLVLADRAAIFVNAVFDQPIQPGFVILVGVLLYAFQLYTDFSGCMDIVIGVSECFQIVLPENFNTPFASRSFAEFWRRWHMTMGLWFKDYLLYPLLKSGWFQAMNQWLRKRLGRKYGKKAATCLGLSVLWIVIGLWHGGSTLYIVVSGVIPGFFLVMGELLETPLKKLTAALRVNTDCLSWRLFSQLRILLAMCCSWVFMRVGEVRLGLKTALSIFTDFSPWIFHNGKLLNYGIDIYDWGILLIGLLILVVVGVWHERGIHIREEFQKQNLVFRWLVLLMALLTILILGIYGPGYDAASFIYKEF
ncbi:MAG: hypothetical protein RR865_08665 [Clostridia bacterium]